MNRDLAFWSGGFRELAGVMVPDVKRVGCDADDCRRDEDGKVIAGSDGSLRAIPVALANGWIRVDHIVGALSYEQQRSAAGLLEYARKINEDVLRKLLAEGVKVPKMAGDSEAAKAWNDMLEKAGKPVEAPKPNEKK